MLTVSVAEIKAHLSEFLDKVENGESVLITRHGRPIAQLSAAVPAKQPLPPLAALRARMPRLHRPSSEILRDMRDGEL